MKRLEIDQPTIEMLFAGRNGIFSVPFYQRPYSWQEEQCAELWHDLNYFAFPNGRADEFNPDQNGYFLGNMVTYPNEQGQSEIVDGQQRIISLLLLMRALYEDLRETENGRQLGKCIWYFEENGALDMSRPRVVSNAIMEWHKDKIKQILLSGNVKKGDYNNYASNYRFFRTQIAAFRDRTPDNLEKMAARLLRNVYVTRMEANSENQALQLFLTINDRGTALRIEDIFQAKLYEDAKSRSDEDAVVFLDKWHGFDERCKKLFSKDANLSPIEFAFLLYALQRQANLSWQTLKNFYSDNDYALLKSSQTFASINAMLDFFTKMHGMKGLAFTFDMHEGTLRKAYTLLRCMKNSAWTLLATYFFKHRQIETALYGEELDAFLERAIACLLSSSLQGGGVSIFKPRKICETAQKILSVDIPDEMKISEATARNIFNHFYELPQFTRAQQTFANWWTFQNENQPLIPWTTKLQCEHIFPRSLVTQREFGEPNNIELPGNITLLDGTQNRKATNFVFTDKCKVYLKSKNQELQRLATELPDFAEKEILARNQQILEATIALLNKNGFLLK